MADIKELTNWTLDQLRSVGQVYDGMVPKTVPTLPSGAVQPYLAVWTQPLREHPEQPLSYEQQETAGGLIVTVVGNTPGTVRAWSQAVVRLLHRVPTPGDGEYRHVMPYTPILFDEQVTPGRYYQPVEFSYQQP